MKKIDRVDLWLFAAQAAVWAVILLALPLATLLSTQDLASTATSFRVAWRQFHSPLIVYFLNFYLLGPWLFFRRRFWLFGLCNLVLIVALNHRFYLGWLFMGNRPDMPAMPTRMWIGMASVLLISVMLNIVVIAIAVGLRHFWQIRQIKQQLKEERAKNTEAELAWLKSQINPHFLFNTLNNISSLTQIDPDAAQDAIAQLSDLLRYAMYETNKKTVPIQGEVEFMRNYIGLMKLRCNEKTTVNAQFPVLGSAKPGDALLPKNSQLEVAPLLFISLIENAFKHGTSSNRPSTIDICLELTDNRLVFTCDNTNYPKDDADRSGSGIGLDNTRRRLELLYGGRYEWQQWIADNVYHVKITIEV